MCKTMRQNLHLGQRCKYWPIHDYSHMDRNLEDNDLDQYYDRQDLKQKQMLNLLLLLSYLAQTIVGLQFGFQYQLEFLFYVGMFMSGGNNCTTIFTSIINFPSSLIFLTSHLHLVHVFGP